MIAHQVEAIVLRTWPIHEADQIVSLFTRDYGKIKGVAKAAARSRRRFGGAMEPMTHVRASYAEKPRQELVRLDSFDIVTSPLSAPVDYARAAALAFFSEVLEETLPDHDPQDAVFRLLVAVLSYTRNGAYLDARHLLCAVDDQAHGVASGADPLRPLWNAAGRAACLFSPAS